MVTGVTDTNRERVVLIVDDEPSIHQMLDRLLPRNGFVTVHAATLHESLQLAAQHPVDAVILDLKLSRGTSGLSFLEWLRAQPQFVHTPVLILTGHVALSEDEEDVIRRHGAYVFFKPQRGDALVDYLRRLTR